MTPVHTRGCNARKCALTYGRVICGAPLDIAEDFTFACVRCERRVGYCMGAADDMPALCDDCFCVVDGAGVAEALCQEEP